MKKPATRTLKHEIRFGSESIPLLMEFRAVKRLSISVHPDRRVTVSAPDDKPFAEILARVNRRARWIFKQRAYFEQFQPILPEKQYITGESFRYLGRQYRLKIVKSATAYVKLIGRYLWVKTPTPESSTVKSLLEHWYRERARAIFAKHFQVCLAAARSLKLSPPPIQILKLKKRWGSCTRAGKIILNLDLVSAPVHCIDYVIMHELCHLRIHSHSSKFYASLTRYMPDWKARKKRLESFVI